MCATRFGADCFGVVVVVGFAYVVLSAASWKTSFLGFSRHLVSVISIDAPLLE